MIKETTQLVLLFRRHGRSHKIAAGFCVVRNGKTVGKDSFMFSNGGGMEVQVSVCSCLMKMECCGKISSPGEAGLDASPCEPWDSTREGAGVFTC